MLYSKKMLSILVVTLLSISIVMAVPVYADVDVSVSTVGDVSLTVAITDGTLTIIYNGVDLLAELQGLQTSVQSLSTYINAVSMANAATQGDVSEMNRTINQLIGELDIILDELYTNTAILARTIGLDSNSSVAENLKSGNYTLVSYCESMISSLNQVSVNILNLDAEIENLANHTDTQLQTIYNELTQQRQALQQSVSSDVQTLGDMLQNESITQKNTAQNVQALQQRVDDYIIKETKEGEQTRELLLISVVVAVGTITTTALVYTNKKKDKKSKTIFDF